MSNPDRLNATIRAVEMLMLEKFRTEPFQNLNLIYGPSHRPLPGGTCSDKTISFVEAGRQAGFDVSLHTGFIGGQEIHRLARVCVDNRVFFADVGNGWPALKLYPAHREITHRCFGMRFRTEIADGRVTVFHERQGRQGGESLQLEIDVCGRHESEIYAAIERRFNSGVIYPFSDSIRFSQIIGSRFLFLRGNRLEIHSDDGFECLKGITDARVPAVLRQYFHFDPQSFFPNGMHRHG
jgi:arylamine N-acetyltransferase